MLIHKKRPSKDGPNFQKKIIIIKSPIRQSLNNNIVYIGWSKNNKSTFTPSSDGSGSERHFFGHFWKRQIFKIYKILSLSYTTLPNLTELNFLRILQTEWKAPHMYSIGTFNYQSNSTVNISFINKIFSKYQIMTVINTKC